MQAFNAWPTNVKGVYEPFNDLQKINYEVIENINHENMSLYSDNMANCVHGIQLMTSKITQPEQLFKSQMALWVEQNERVLEYGQNVLKIMLNGLRNYRECMEENMASPLSSSSKHETRENKVSKAEQQRERDKRDSH